jgi:hypothetical protein
VDTQAPTATATFTAEATEAIPATSTPLPPVVLPETGGSLPTGLPWLWVGLGIALLAGVGFFFRRALR